MGWRTNFTDAVVDALQDITGIGHVTRDEDIKEMEFPALTVNITNEAYDRTLGLSQGPVTVDFSIMGKIESGNLDKYRELDDLVDDVIQAVEGITGYSIVIEETLFHERIKGSQLQFETVGNVVIEKDYAGM